MGSCIKTCLKRAFPAIGFFALGVAVVVVLTILGGAPLTLGVAGLTIVLTTALAKILGGAVLALLAVVAVLVRCLIGCVGQRG